MRELEPARAQRPGEVVRERDLGRLRERSDDTAGRKLGLFALAGTLSVAAIISAGVLSGSATEPEPVPPDPLMDLALTSGAAPKDLQAAEAAESARLDPEALTRLSFPAILSGEEGPLAAGVRATSREQTRTGRRVVASETPASTLAGEETERLQRATRHDPLMAQAMPERSGALAPVGGEGAFTLQVVSFQTRDAAERFVNALRARGHRAFLAQSELPGRGRSFRVRIGPFTTRREALLYQQSFEQTERMHGIVVTGSAP